MFYVAESINATVPANCTVIVGTYKLHRREDIFPNPDHSTGQFPSRKGRQPPLLLVCALQRRTQELRRKYRQLKFEGDPLNCAQEFPRHARHSEKDWVLQADIILKRTDGFRIKLQPENQLYQPSEKTQIIVQHKSYYDLVV
ncbi:hypothetical protein LSTR_LSTR014948 [Laodelphax striatellus]|uniref:Uncharacterized protein n=1 Tax=Laodelphax striatellus TaxID=195883 RepID=A0A482WJT6_LAOST|nr:hypothetical protein LSTR_LSTR014948 [Laodelphax striatellus]